MKLPFVPESTVESVVGECIRGDSLEFVSNIILNLHQYNPFLEDAVLKSAMELKHQIEENPDAHTPDVIAGKVLFQVATALKIIGVQLEVDAMEKDWPVFLDE
jgi:hypothetical protein